MQPLDTSDNSDFALGAEWLLAIPPTTLQEVVSYVVNTWEGLKGDWPQEHCFSHPEPVLSLSLGQRLNEPKRKRAAGVSGAFLAEAYEPVRSGGYVVKNGRTDIKFVFGGLGAPEVILECKKLDGTATKRSLYCSQGVGRFVTGKYAPEYQQGIMLGFTKEDVEQEYAELSALFAIESVKSEYRCLQFSDGESVLQPSVLVTHQGAFDTKHARDPNGVSPFDLAHVLLSSPQIQTN